MKMRDLINLMEMSMAEAERVFTLLGVDVQSLDDETLKKEYRKLLMKHHPDKGGKVETAQMITSAYDVLKGKPSIAQGGYRASTGPSERPQPRAAFSMDHPDFKNVDYVKYYFEQLTAGTPHQMWSVMNFDGRFFRNSFTIRGSYDLFPKMAKAMRVWDRHYDCRAVFVTTEKMAREGIILLIYADNTVIDPFITLNFDSPNLNPANDQQFCRQLPHILDAVADGSFVNQHMLD